MLDCRENPSLLCKTQFVSKFMIQTIPDAIGPDQKKLINIRFLIPPKIRKRYSVVEGSVHHPEI